VEQYQEICFRSCEVFGWESREEGSRSWITQEVTRKIDKHRKWKNVTKKKKKEQLRKAEERIEKTKPRINTVTPRLSTVRKFFPAGANLKKNRRNVFCIQ